MPLDSGEAKSRAALARALGVLRARVTQVLRVLDLPPEILKAISDLGEPLPRRMVSERVLRELVNAATDEQHIWLTRILTPPTS